jgi:hypothetical protein
VIPKPISDFLRTAIPSTWALDALRLLKNAPDRAWTPAALSAELRGSIRMVQEILPGLQRWGLVSEESGRWRYLPENALDVTVTELMQLYAERPVAVIAEIALSPNEKLYTFIDAFRVKKD